MKTIREMSVEEIKAKMNSLLPTLNNPNGEEWDSAYSEFFALDAELQKREIEDSKDDFEDFYNTFIKGRNIEEIDASDWNYYSDWHKDLFGYRPRHT